MDYMPGLDAFIMNPLAAARANAAQPNAGITPSQPAPTMPTQASAPTTAMALPQIADYLTNLLGPSPIGNAPATPGAAVPVPTQRPAFPMDFSAAPSIPQTLPTMVSMAIPQAPSADEAQLMGLGARWQGRSMSAPAPVLTLPAWSGKGPVATPPAAAAAPVAPPTAVGAPSAGPTSLTPGQQQAQRMMTAPNTPHPDWHTLDEFVNHYSGKLSNLDVMRILEAHKASTPEMQRYQTLETTSRNETQQKIAAILADTKLSDAKKNEAIRAAQFEHANRLFSINNPTSQLLGGIGAGPSPFAPTPKT